MIQVSTLNGIASAIIHARQKHPQFATDKIGAWRILGEEIGEIMDAETKHGKGSPEYLAECYDAIAVLVRMIEGDK